MAPQYKLSYFNLKALAEPSRLLLAYANVEYEDNRVEFTDWPTLKPTMPWGKMPVLEVLEGDSKGFLLSQSVAILEYLAKKHDLAGATDEETATCNEYVGAMNDVRQAGVAYNQEKDEEKKVELGKKLYEETFPLYLGKFNGIIEKNGTYLVGKSLTFADLYVAHFLQMSLSMKPDLIDSYSALKEHQDTVFGLPGIKEWVEKRPVTQW